MFCLAQDNDSHWYVLPVDKLEEWDRFLSIPSYDELSWDAPEWAVRINGSYQLVVFPSYEIK